MVSPLLELENSELIIINNSEEVIESKYEYTLYNFKQSYLKFKEFCFASSRCSLVIIIEDGMVITKDIISWLLKNIDEDFYNIGCKFKKYISRDKSIFFIHDGTLLYRRGIKGFNRESGIVIDDLCLIETEDWEFNIQRLIKGGFYRELYKWYEWKISKMSQEYQEKFFENLELTRRRLLGSEDEGISSVFIEGSCYSRYKNYLEIVNLIKEKTHDVEYISDKIMDMKFTSKELYAAWIVYDFIDNKDFCLKILSCFANETLKFFIDYLLKVNPLFPILVYEFILNWEDSSELNSFSLDEIKSLFFIMTEYISSMSKESGSPDIKDKLLKVFDILINLSKNYMNEMDFDAEFIKTVANGIKAVDDGDLQGGISLLKSSINLNNSFSDIINIYIQRLRSKFNFYPYILSICMIVKNEGKNLERCLKSLEPLLNSGTSELIIVDTGSTDKTIDIAKKYTDNIYARDWRGNFSSSRNYSISLANGEYIFILDADEELKPTELSKLMEEFSSKTYKIHNTFSFKLINYTDINLTQYALLTQPRIFKNNGRFYYSSAVHNQPMFSIPVKNLDIFIHHYGYIMTEDVKERKFKRTATLLKQELEKDPQNIYYRFQLSTSYAMHGDGEKALKHVELYMRGIKALGNIDDSHLMYYNNAASIYLGNALYDKVLKLCDEALSVKPDFIDFIYYKASILFEKKEYSTSLEYIKRYLDTLDQFYSMDISKDGRYSFYTIGFRDDALGMLCISSYMEEDYRGCIDSGFLIEDFEALKKCMASIIDSSMYLKEYTRLYELYDRILSRNDKNALNIFKVLLKLCIIKHFKMDMDKAMDLIPGNKAYSSFISEAIKDASFPGIDDILFLASSYDLDVLDCGLTVLIFSRTLQELLKYSPALNDDFNKVTSYKRLAQYILHRTQELKHFKRFSPERLIEIFKKYMDLCSIMIKNGQGEQIEVRERKFLLIVSEALRKIEAGNTQEFLRLSQKSINIYSKMKGFMGMAIQILLPNEDDNEKVINSEAYCTEAKNNLVNIVQNGSIDNILEFFNLYNNEELYDSQLFSIKSLIFLEDGRYCDGEKVLKTGLKKHPNDIKLLNNISKLYKILGRDKEMAEYYSKGRILELEFDPSSINKEIDISKEGIGSRLKVLHGTLDITDRTSKMVTALKGREIDASSINYYAANRTYSSDYIMDVNLIPSGSDILFFSTSAAAKLISEFDIFHFHYGTTLTFHNYDIAALRELGKKTIVHFWGNDVRISSKAKDLNPYFFSKNAKDDLIKKKLEFLSKYTDMCIVPDFEIYEYVKDYFENVQFIPPMIDLKIYKPSFVKNKDDRIKIIHAPVSANIKGTKHIIKAINSLQENSNIDFKIIQGISNDEAIRLYRDADIIIDQLLMGSYGQLAIEAMSLGKPVICYISDFMKEKYPSELPIISANPDNIKERLEYLIKNRDMLYDIGVKGRMYIEKYHDVNSVINKLIVLYKGLFK